MTIADAIRTLPSYVDRRRCLLLEKNLHFLCITIYVHCNTFTKVHEIAMVLSLYKLYKFFLIVLYTTSMVQWLEHWQADLMLRVQVTLDFSKRFSLPGISLLFIDPCIY